MAPNLKVELLALHDQLLDATNEESTIDVTNLLLNKKDHVVVEAGDPDDHNNLPPPPIDSDSYWDWPTTDVPPIKDDIDDEGVTEASSPATRKHGSDAQQVTPLPPTKIKEKLPNTVDDTAKSSSGSSSSSTLDETVKTNDDYWAERNHDEDINTKFFIDYSREMGRAGGGSGSKGAAVVVRKAIERKTGKRFAVKTYSKRKYTQEDVKKEAAMMMMACCGGGDDHHRHPNIAQCYGTYQDSNYFHTVMEYIGGGELYDLVIERATAETKATNKTKKSKTTTTSGAACAPPPVFTEPEAGRILQQLLSAVAHCHSCGIVHRDVKLENIMIANKKQKKTKGNHPFDVKVIDFGLAARIPQQERGGDQQLLFDRVGTNFYVAPEVLSPCGRDGYNEKVDVWSVGVIAYTLFSAMPPFRGVTEEETYDLIRNENVNFNQQVWESVSPQAKDFILSCLQKDPNVRPSAEALLKNQWLQQQSALVEESSAASKRDSSSSKRFVRKIKKALHLS